MKKEQAELIVRSHAMSALAAGFIPIPLMDTASITAVQIDMIKNLCMAYDVSYDVRSTKALMATLGTTALSRVGARLAIKMIPGIGTLVGGAAVAITSAAGTYALGKVYIQHFEKGGTVLDLDPTKVKTYYEEQLEKGKRFVSGLKPKAKVEQVNEDTFVTTEPADQPKTNNNPSETNELMEQLENAADMKAKGLINDEEFVVLKKRILGL
jgi:uncharacterized protein (DUF697 family)